VVWLMELSSPRDRTPAPRWKRFWPEAMEDGIVDDAVIAANLSQRQASGSCATRCRRRRSRRAADQARHLGAGRAVPDFIAEADAAW